MHVLQGSIRTGRMEEVAARLVMITSMALATAAGSQLVIPLPFTPVPFTMQMFAVFLTGLVMRPGDAFAAQALYVGAGVVGLPWFAALSSAGVWSPSFGYLVGFMAAAPLIAMLKREVGSLRACGAGLAVTYLAGSLHLWTVTRSDPSAVLVMGVLPFLPGDLVKMVLAARVSRVLGTE